MAYGIINLKNPLTGKMRQAPVGFSWTTLFFGFLVALIRSDWIGAAVQAALAFFTFGLSGFFFMFVYNKWHLKRLINDGYQVTGGTVNISTLEHKMNLPLPRLAV